MPYALPMRLALPALFLTLAAPASASADPAAKTGLAMFASLLGRCFVGAVGSGASDTHCFEAMFGGSHVRDRHVVVIDGKAVYRGETIYSRSGPDIVFTYINALGGVGHGSAKATGSGIAFTGTMRGGPDSKVQPMDSTWKWLSPSGYEAADGSGTPIRFKPVAQKAR